MGWVVLYLISIIVVAAIYAGNVISTRDNNGDYGTITVTTADDIINSLQFLIFWPIAVPVLLIRNAIVKSKDNMRNEALSILKKYGFYSGNTAKDNSFVINIPENKLKCVLRAHRKKMIDLDAHHAEIIRNELLSRNMERNLLK